MFQNRATGEHAVRKSIRVHASAERAFTVFAEEMDGWWPRSHHIGSSPMTRLVVEGRAGGRIFSEQEDGTICPWATVLAWEPPRRFAFAWQISAEWTFEPDLSKCSEVEVTFTPDDDGTTLVELDHRHFERHGGDYEAMRASIGSEMGWGSLLELFAIASDASND